MISFEVLPVTPPPPPTNTLVQEAPALRHLVVRLCEAAKPTDGHGDWNISVPAAIEALLTPPLGVTGPSGNANTKSALQQLARVADALASRIP